MAKTDNRERILAVERILESARMPLTPQKITNRLKSIYNIDANRKTILADIYALTRFINIQQAGRNEGYYIADNIADEESEDNDANSTMSWLRQAPYPMPCRVCRICGLQPILCIASGKAQTIRRVNRRIL